MRNRAAVGALAYGFVLQAEEEGNRVRFCRATMILREP
jgi:hypothetical protein